MMQPHPSHYAPRAAYAMPQHYAQTRYSRAQQIASPTPSYLSGAAYESGNDYGNAKAGHGGLFNGGFIDHFHKNFYGRLVRYTDAAFHFADAFNYQPPWMETGRKIISGLNALVAPKDYSDLPNEGFFKHLFGWLK